MVNHPGPAHSWKALMYLNTRGQGRGAFLKIQNPVRGTGEGPPRNEGTSGGGLELISNVNPVICLHAFQSPPLPPIGQMPSEDKEDEILKGYRPLKSGQGRSRRTQRLTLSLTSCDLTSLYLSFQKIIVS